MLKIQNKLDTISKILGEQQIDDVKYRLTNFAITEKTDEGILLYNNLTKELFLLSADEYQEINSGEISVLSSFATALVKNWFLVPVEFDEIKLCDQLRETVRQIEAHSKIKNYTILPTTACNARCFYCFEAGAKSIVMTKQIALDVADYIKKKSEGAPVKIAWFGGEPLCNMEAIDIITKQLSASDISYASTMVSNGYLFDECSIKKAKELWHLQWVQITLDGLAETYNRVKSYKNNDENAFERVLNNIEELCKNDITVQVRMNMDNYNAVELRELTNLLYDRFSRYKKFVLYANMLYKGVGYNNPERSEEERQELSKKYLELCNYLDEKNFFRRSMNFNKFKTYSCQADRPDTVMISPDGHLGFCEHYVDGDFFGTIYEDIKKPVWSDFKPKQDECYTCAVYPSCLRLSKCPGAKKCYDNNRFSRIKNIRTGMVMAYERQKSKEEKASNV